MNIILEVGKKTAFALIIDRCGAGLRMTFVFCRIEAHWKRM
jgi:hypothetical protein